MVQRGKSGIAKYVLSLAKALIPYSREHQFSLLILEEDAPLFQFAAEAMTLVTVDERWRAPLSNILWHQSVLPFWLRANGIDVLHVPSYRRMLSTAPCALVTTIHDLAQFHVPGKYDIARSVYSRIIARALCHRQDRVVAVSKCTRDDLVARFRMPRERLRVIYNGVDHDRFTPGDRHLAQMRVETQHGISKPFFLYVSRIEHPAKNHARLISAFDQFRLAVKKEYQLVFVGSDWKGADFVHSKARYAKFAEDIRFLGFVEDHVLPDLYRAAEALVFPSLFEGFGFPPVEAMACGCPVLTSCGGSLREIASGSAYVFAPDDEGEIREALMRVVSDQQWCERTRRAGLLNAARYTWQENARNLLSVYQEAIDVRVRKHEAGVRPLRSELF